eukprot:ctg_342.g241
MAGSERGAEKEPPVDGVPAVGGRPGRGPQPRGQSGGVSAPRDVRIAGAAGVLCRLDGEVGGSVSPAAVVPAAGGGTVGTTGGERARGRADVCGTDGEDVSGADGARREWAACDGPSQRRRAVYGRRAARGGGGGPEAGDGGARSDPTANDRIAETIRTGRAGGGDAAGSAVGAVEAWRHRLRRRQVTWEEVVGRCQRRGTLQGARHSRGIHDAQHGVVESGQDQVVDLGGERLEQRRRRQRRGHASGGGDALADTTVHHAQVERPMGQPGQYETAQAALERLLGAGPSAPSPPTTQQRGERIKHPQDDHTAHRVVQCSRRSTQRSRVVKSA